MSKITAPGVYDAAEHWLPIVDFEGLYEVSDCGRVRSLDRIIVDHFGRRKPCAGKVLRPGRCKSGHMLVVLGRGNCRHVHRLVLAAFVGACPEGHECLHGDDDPSNNRLSNLRWGTRSDNLYDAVRNGHKPIGEYHASAKFKTADIIYIRELSKTVEQRTIARQFNVGEATISNIVNRKTWKSVA